MYARINYFSSARWKMGCQELWPCGVEGGWWEPPLREGDILHDKWDPSSRQNERKFTEVRFFPPPIYLLFVPPPHRYIYVYVYTCTVAIISQLYTYNTPHIQNVRLFVLLYLLFCVQKIVDKKKKIFVIADSSTIFFLSSRSCLYTHILLYCCRTIFTRVNKMI